MQWNGHSVLGKLVELRALIARTNASIILLNESWLQPGDILDIDGFLCFRCDRYLPAANGCTYGGAAILIRTEVPIRKVFKYNTARSEWLAMKIAGSNGKDFIVATGYRSPDEPLDMGFLKQCMDGFGNDSTPCIFAGDLNAWHPDLASGPTKNDSGNAIVEWCQVDNIALLSDGSPTHFSIEGVGRQIDIWLGNRAACGLPGCAGSPVDYYGSDHLATFLQVSHNLSLSSYFSKDDDEPRLNFGKANWPLYERELSTQLALLAEPLKPKPGDPVDSIDRYHTSIVQAMRNAAATAIPRCPAKRLQAWRLNRNIGEALEAKNRLQRLRDKYPGDPEITVEIKLQTKKIRQLIGATLRKKNERILRETAKLFNRNESKWAWSRIGSFFSRKKRKPPISSLVDSAEQVVTEDGAKASLLADNLSSTLSEAPKPETDRKTTDFWAKTETKVRNDPGMKPLASVPANSSILINRDLMRLTMRKLKWKAPGEDGISNLLLKKGGPALEDHLRCLYNASLASGYLPQAWKTAVVIPILKEGKDSRQPGSYRPISLLSSIGKLLESLVANFLQDWCIRNKILPEHQAGFRCHRCTVDPIFRLVCDAALAMARKKRMVAVFLDFKAAFDTVWHDGLRWKLKAVGVPEPFLRWISNFLRDRSFQVKVGQELSQSHPIRCGVPQGSPLSPLLFILYTADMMPKGAKPDDAWKRVASGTYADDATNWAAGSNLTKVTSRIQSRLVVTQQWCNKWRLILNETKCEFMTFGHHGRPANIALTINQKNLKQVSEYKYLGIVLCPLLGWDSHISLISAKVKWRIGALRGIASRRILSPKLTMLFYRAYILSGLLYGAPAWLCMSKACGFRLFELQSAGIRAALDLPLDADPFAAVAEAGHATIDVTMLETCERYGQRLFEINRSMAEFIRFHLNQDLNPAESAALRELSPAFKLEHLRNAPIRRALLPTTILSIV